MTRNTLSLFLSFWLYRFVNRDGAVDVFWSQRLSTNITGTFNGWAARILSIAWSRQKAS